MDLQVAQPHVPQKLRTPLLRKINQDIPNDLFLTEVFLKYPPKNKWAKVFICEILNN